MRGRRQLTPPLTSLVPNRYRIELLAARFPCRASAVRGIPKSVHANRQGFNEVLNEGVDAMMVQRRRSGSKSTCSFMFVVCALLLTNPWGCVEDESNDIFVVGQSIYYGSRSPTVVPMSDGEQLAVGYLADRNGDPFCSATLVDRDMVVTAGHCANNRSTYFGVGHPDDPQGLFLVDHTDVHRTLDAAVMFLVDDAVTSLANLEPLPLLRSALPNSKVGTQVEAAGYGMTHDGSTGRYFAALTLEDIDSEYYIVNGHGERGICYGDSGGPLLVELDGFTVVAGVESWGE